MEDACGVLSNERAGKCNRGVLLACTENVGRPGRNAVLFPRLRADTTELRRTPVGSEKVFIDAIVLHFGYAHLACFS